MGNTIHVYIVLYVYQMCVSDFSCPENTIHQRAALGWQSLECGMSVIWNVCSFKQVMPAKRAKQLVISMALIQNMSEMVSAVP